MIVELFGPAGAGKTTFAHALRERLSANGHSARVVLSYQPGMEVLSLDPGGAIAAIRRIARAIIATLVIAARPIAEKTNFPWHSSWWEHSRPPISSGSYDWRSTSCVCISVGVCGPEQTT